MFCRVIESILSIVFYAKYGRCDVHICLTMGSTLASMFVVVGYLGLYSLSDKTSYRKISKSWSRKIGCYNDRISLTFDMHLGNAAAEVRVKFQCDWKTTEPLKPTPRMLQFSQVKRNDRIHKLHRSCLLYYFANETFENDYTFLENNLKALIWYFFKTIFLLSSFATFAK